MNIYLRTIKRTCLLSVRNPVNYLTPWLFFLSVMILFPLAVSPSVRVLKMMGPGVIWVAVLLASMISLPHFLQDDKQDGVLDQWLMTPSSLPLLLSSKLAAHWVISILPIILIVPLLGVMFHLSLLAIGILMASLLLGTPILCILGAIVAALCVNIEEGGLLLAIIVLPLYIPTLIFGCAAVAAAQHGTALAPQMALLGAFLALSVTFGPSVVAFALRTGITYS